MVCSVLPSGGWRGARGDGPSRAGARVRGPARGGLRAGRPHRRGGQELHGVRSAGRARRPADRAPHGAAGRPAAAFGRDLRVSSRDHRRADRGVRGVHRNGVHRDPEPRAARGSRQRLSRGRRRVCAALRAHLGQAVRVRQHVRDRRASAGRRAVRLAADLRRRARRAPLEGGVRLRVPGAPGRLRRFGAGVRPEVRRAADGNGARPHLPRSRRRQGGPDRRQLHGRRHPGSGPRGPGRRSALLPSIRGGAGGARGPAGAPPRDRPCAGRAGREDLGRRDAASQRARGRGAPGDRGHRARVARPDAAVSARIIRTYFAITALFNLAMSLIWGIDTLFKMGAGLDIQQVLLTNAAFTLGSMVFEVPTGVVADTVGRRVSLLLCLVTLFVTTLLYVAIAWRGWGFWAFAWVSVLLGLGYTFYTGAVDAWLVDALKASGYDEPLERVFSRGQMLFGAAMLVGTIGGGLLGQIRLDIPYLVRAALVVPLFLLAWFRMPELGFTPRALQLRRVPAELRRVFVEGLTYGLHNPVVRPVMLASLVSMSFMIFGFYSWQRYFLDLLGRNLVWVDGVISALVGLSLIVGNACVGPLSRVVRTRTGLLMLSAGAQTVLAVACGLLTNFFAVVSLYLLYGVAVGLALPVKQAYLNAHIPSAQRATIISLDSMFASSGGVLGQTVWGWLGGTGSVGSAWAWSGLTLLLGIPLYWIARRRDQHLDTIG